MEAKYVIGIDISKKKIDCAVLNFDFKVIKTKEVTNEKKAIKAFISSFIKKEKISLDDVVVCCENTGIYNRLLEAVCMDMGVKLWVEHALKVKRASTDMRGKDDKNDSIRIARYCIRYIDQFISYEECSKEVKELNVLSRCRDTLLKQKVAIENQLKEAKKFDPFEYKVLEKSYKSTKNQLIRKIKQLDEEINQLIDSIPEMKKNRDLLLSIKGIGIRNVIGFIIATDNFKNFSDPKHLACYAGVVPFKNESGGYVGRPRVSKMANLNLKSLLHMAAISAIRHNKELKEYYLRKVEEGKNKMSVINAVRNKLVHRIMAIINRQTPYLTKEEFLLKKETKIVAF